jgi:hypothetical protein
MENRMTPAERRAAERAEIEAREREIYGDLVDDVRVLRGRSFFVAAQDGGAFVVGTKTVDRDGLRALADRERRLMGHQVERPAARQVEASASGLKVGQVEAYQKPQRRPPVAAPPPSRALSGAARISKEKADATSADLGPPPRLDWLPLDRLTVDARYQRALGADNWKHIKRIAREWSWLHYQPIVCAPAADGGFVVIDGQHRLEAARHHPAIDRLPAYIVAAADLAQQARAFVALNGQRIGVTRLQRFWAAHAAGDRTAVRIAALCAAADVTIARSIGVQPPRTTVATFTIEKLLPLGAPAVGSALQALATAHRNTRDGIKGAIIAALARMLADPGLGVGVPALVALLRPLDLDQLIVAGKRRRIERGGSLESAVEGELRDRLQLQRSTNKQ